MNVLAAAQDGIRGRLVVSAERPAFEAALARHERMVLGLAYRILGSSEEARDAAQEVFLRLHRNCARIPGDEVGPWLYRVTMNVCFDLRRARRPAVALEVIEMAGNEIGPDRAAEANQRRRMLLEEIDRLPERERAAVVLRELEGLDTAEVAGILGVTEVTVRSQISSARTKLKRALERRLAR
jgi:RNA polymerase sigma-70 factor (ECF subfamily)